MNKMHPQRYRAQDLIEFGRNVLVEIGFPEEQAKATA